MTSLPHKRGGPSRGCGRVDCRRCGTEGAKVAVEALSRRTFADVTPEHASDWGLDELAALGIVNGYPDGTFAPRRSMTQGELAAALQRMLQWVDRELAEIKSAHGETQPGSAPQK